MSHNVKTVILLVVLIVIVIIGWVWYSMSNSSTPTTQTTATGVQQSSPAQQSASADAGLTTSPTNTSDAAIQTDLNSVDTQMNNLSADSANINI